MPKKLKIHCEDPPSGYSFVGLWDNEASAQKWYAAALKARDKKPYMLTYSNGMYHLWVLKPKGKGKMMGIGFKVK